MAMIRTLFLKRPLALTLALYLTASFFSLYLRPACLSWLFIFLCAVLVLLLAATVVTLCRHKSAGHFLLSFLLLFALLLPCGIGMTLAHRQASLGERFQESEVYAVFKATSVTRYDALTVAYGTLTPEGESESFRTIVYFFKNAEIDDGGRYREIGSGDTMRGSFLLSAIEGDTLSELSQYADGYELSGSYSHHGEVLSHQTGIVSLRQSLAEKIDARLGSYGSGVIKALLIADNASLSADIKTHFATLGISHLLAVSGLHLTILIGCIASLFKRFSLRRKIAYPILALLIVFYAAITDFAPSLLRAGGMLLLFYLSGGVRRQRDTLTALLFATSAIVLVNPKAILDIGLLLSFLATLGIVTLASPLLRALSSHPYFEVPTTPKRFLYDLLSSCTVTLAASLYIMPILFLISGEVFLLAPLSNLLFSVLFTALLYLLPVFLITLPIPLVSTLISLCLELLSMLTVSLSYLAIPLKPFSLSLGYRFLPYLFLLLILIALPFFFKKRHLIAFLILSGFLLLAPLGIAIDNTLLERKESVSYYSDGKNDLLFVEYGEHRAAVVFSASGNFVKNTVASGGLSSPSVTLDTLFLTNVSNAQAAWLYSLWENGTLTHLILPKRGEASDYLATFAESLGLTVTRYTPNDTVLYNGIPITTHASTDDVTVAVSIALAEHTLLYVKENAPNDFDIRFGVIKQHHNTVILGSYGNDMKGSLILDCDEVWEYERRSYVVPQKSQSHRYGNSIVSDKREEAEP